MKDDWNTRASECATTASEERRIAVIERGLRNGLAYLASGVCTAVVGVFFEHPADKYFMSGATLLLLKGTWMLVKTASRAKRRRKRTL